MAHPQRSLSFAFFLLAMVPTSVFAVVLNVPADHPQLRWEGRTSQGGDGSVDASWPTTRLVLRFRGTGVSVQVDSGRTWWNVTIDGQLVKPLQGGAGGWKVATEGLVDTEHDLILSKRTESFVGRARVRGLRVEGASPAVLQASPENSFGIEFVGNSITCGYGVHAGNPEEGFQDSSEDADATASAIAARALGAQYRSACRTGYGVIRDASGALNNLPGIYDRIHPESSGDWDHSRWHPDIVVVNLGTNDFHKGVPDSTTFYRAYANFLRHVVAVHPGVAIALLHGPMIADGYPLDSLGVPIPGASKLRAHIRTLLQRLRPELGTPMDSILLTPQSVEVGFGGDYHPNHAQSALNGAQIAVGLRRAFPALLASVQAGPRSPAPGIASNSWSGDGPWQVEFLDLEGRSISTHRGVGAGRLEALHPPRGLAIARIRQDGRTKAVRIAVP